MGATMITMYTPTTRGYTYQPKQEAKCEYHEVPNTIFKACYSIPGLIPDSTAKNQSERQIYCATDAIRDTMPCSKSKGTFHVPHSTYWPIFKKKSTKNTPKIVYVHGRLHKIDSCSFLMGRKI